MADFGIRFFLCNIFICFLTGMLLATKRVFQKILTSRMQFHLWFLLFALLAVPLIPVRPAGFIQFLSWSGIFRDAVSADGSDIADTSGVPGMAGIAGHPDDFALSVSSGLPSATGLILCGIWFTGMAVMLLFILKSEVRFHVWKKSALPVQNRAVRILYKDCLRRMKIKRKIPVYSTAYLKSPVIAGLFRPCIYLPIELISDFNGADLRYMLLHELQHYKHKDAIAGFFMNLFRVLYWFNPMVWLALKEMCSDREIACDTSVLNLLSECEYKEYGNTLICLAEKISRMPSLFSAGISGTMKQMQRRIANIASYQKPSFYKKVKGTAAFVIIAAILWEAAPMLSTYAADQNRYPWKISSQKVFICDLSEYFSGYDGSFVLYDLKEDIWKIYNPDHATLRTSPNSSYKIYDALFALEEGLITPDHSFLAWDGTDYPYESWNKDQDLYSAMQSSVNWYFQKMDMRLGLSTIQSYLHKTGYGNECIRSGDSAYWLQSSLKISPVEQVELLVDLYQNNFDFHPENIQAVKASICLFSSADRSFYGKTGTGRVDGKDVNGWFTGFLETDHNTCFFATHIQSETNATGSRAAGITKAILSELKL